MSNDSEKRIEVAPLSDRRYFASEGEGARRKSILVRVTLNGTLDIWEEKGLVDHQDRELLLAEIEGHRKGGRG